MDKKCTFCTIDKKRIIYETPLVFVIEDRYPISKGHTLVIPKRHIQSFFELTNPEIRDIVYFLHAVKELMHERWKPDAYNIGINDGPVAGQTVPHLHVHLIPRYKDDVDDPRGGVRWIIPSKAKYW